MACRSGVGGGFGEEKMFRANCGKLRMASNTEKLNSGEVPFHAGDGQPMVMGVI